MNKERLQWLIISLLAIAVIGGGVIVFLQQQKIEDVSDRTGNTQPQAPTNAALTPPTTSTAVMFEQQSVSFTDAKGIVDFAIFEHTCAGQIVPSLTIEGQKTVPYCVGKNTLTVTDRNRSITETIDESDTTDASNSPLLLKVETTNASGKTVLVSYAPETCATTANCGAGMPTHYVTIAYFPQTATYVKLHAFPSYGVPVWNPSGTKAVFYPESAGGAGYSEDVLIGYDVPTDNETSVTSERAAWDAHGAQPFNVEGTPLPAWSNIVWIDDDHFTALITNPDGTTKTVSGTVVAAEK